MLASRVVRCNFRRGVHERMRRLTSRGGVGEKRGDGRSIVPVEERVRPRVRSSTDAHPMDKIGAASARQLGAAASLVADSSWSSSDARRRGCSRSAMYRWGSAARSTRSRRARGRSTGAPPRVAKSRTSIVDERKLAAMYRWRPARLAVSRPGRRLVGDPSTIGQYRTRDQNTATSQAKAFPIKHYALLPAGIACIQGGGDERAP